MSLSLPPPRRRLAAGAFLLTLAIAWIPDLPAVAQPPAGDSPSHQFHDSHFHETRQRVLLGNYERIFDEGRRKARAWEKAHAQ